ncbi:hypothetical protein N7478_007118 [Penicillium angulare]|uniref:uncharacterized protein n=1 Tax=Penicillium angulare TaxID=116970 RepID=UPI0025407AC5|nr:uncharacterized protein N7478_007118 [Penicillium angulare]KAJ5281746.1 hypothetical protein N7478_007118 [Penicillium angulare]
MVFTIVSEEPKWKFLILIDLIADASNSSSQIALRNISALPRFPMSSFTNAILRFVQEAMPIVARMAIEAIR